MRQDSVDGSDGVAQEVKAILTKLLPELGQRPARLEVLLRDLVDAH
jgi:hypothetical protein